MKHSDQDHSPMLSIKQQLLRKLLLKQRASQSVPASHMISHLEEEYTPLTFAQQRLWFLEQLGANHSPYNMPVAYHLKGTLHVEVLEKCVQEIMHRHTVLRTVFLNQNGHPVQYVRGSLDMTIPLIDLASLSAQEQEIFRLTRSETRHPFDFVRGPLFRVTLLRVRKDEHVLLATFHHIIADAWSHGIFTYELSEFYTVFHSPRSEASPDGLASRLPDLPIQYTDFARWQRAASGQGQAPQVQTEIFQKQLDYWRQQLAGAPDLLKLPTDRPRPAVQTFAGARLSRLLSLDLHQQLKSLSQRENTTLFMTGFAAFLVLLMRYSGMSDIVVGSPIIQRTRKELEGLIGMFVNMLVLRTDLSGNPPFLQLLERVQQVAVQAYAHQDIPFEKLVEELRPERHLSHQPLFQVSFNVLNVPAPKLAMPDVMVCPMEVEQTIAQFDLSLTLNEGGSGQTFDGLLTTLEYNTDLFDAATMERLLGHWQVLLEAIVRDPGQPIEMLPLLTPEEHEQLLIRWNAISVDYSQDVCLHQLFERQVEQTPDAVALAFGEDEMLTYDELNRLANQLAHRLFAEGIGPDRLVGVCMERSLELVVSLLAVLKAGGAYVPLDPELPQERLTFLLEDAQVSIVLTQSHLKPRLPVSTPLFICLDTEGQPYGHSYSVGHRRDRGFPPLSPRSENEKPLSLRGSVSFPKIPPPESLPTVPPPNMLEPMPQGIAPTEDSSAKIAPPNASWYDSRAGLDVQSDRNPVSQVLPENLAYMIYTSGSTGKPKGVMVTHSNVVRLFAMTKRLFDFHSQDVWTLFHSYAFDFSVWEFWGALLHGGRLLIVPYWLSRSPDEFYQFLVASQVTILNQTPTAFRQLMQVDQASAEGADLALRLVIFGGEALDLGSLRPWFARHGDQQPQLVNMYGITETTVHVTCRPLTQRDVQTEQHQSSVIGGPLVDLQCYVLDKHQQLVPPGVAGELYVGGKGLTRGYWQRADATAERFIPHPFLGTSPIRSTCPEPGARLYRTGDLVRYLATGDLAYLGRIDRQVKLRGFRIELGEIEAILQSHPAVQEAVVVLQEENETSQYLVAYVTPAASNPLASQGGQSAKASQLREHLREQLPDYMVPTHVIFLATLPLTPNGKVDRVALGLAPRVSVLDLGEASQEPGQVAPYTPLQELLGQIWQDVLHKSQVGIHENFFALGGHSLLVTQVVARIRQILHVDLPVRSLFDHPTITGLSHHLEAFMRGAPPTLIPALRPMERPVDLPLSFGQERLWFLHQLAPDSAWYNVPMVLHLKGLLHVEALEESLAMLVQRHEVLRTTFGERLGRPLPVIAPCKAIGAIPCGRPLVPVIDLCGLSASKRDQQVTQLAHAEAQRPFDLAHGPLLRVYLLQLVASSLALQECVLLFSLHHIICDAWSIRVLVRELTALYQVNVSGLPSPLTPLPIQYADYAFWQREWLQGTILQEHLTYWKRQLQGAPALLTLPTDYLRASVQEFYGATLTTHLPLSLSEQLKALSQQEHVTLFMTLLAALVILLARYSGESDIVVGTAIANRTHPALEDLIGFFGNTLVLRFRLTGNPRAREFLQQVREVTLQAYAHQDLPFEKLVEELQPERSLSHHPLFQVMFILHNQPEIEDNLFGLQVSSLVTENQTTKRDLSIAVAETATGLDISWQYDMALFAREKMQRMLDHYGYLLEELVTQPQCTLSELHLLSQQERDLILTHWNPGRPEPPKHTTIVQWVEAQAASTPDKIAVVYGQQSLSYGQLVERIKCVSQALQQRGVGPAARVGLCLERSPELVVGLLGILRAGGAYLPLDPGYPRERLTFMIENAQIALLLSQRHLSDVWDMSIGSISQGCVLCMDSEWMDLSCEACPQTIPVMSPDGAIADENLAAVIYTSGSTGQAKGVMVTHGSINHYLHAMTASLHITAQDVYMHTASFSFSSSIRQLLLPLSQGATVVLASREQISDPLQLFAFIQQQQVSVLDLVPSYWSSCIQTLLTLQHAACSQLLKNNVRLLVTASESCPSLLFQQWRQQLTHPAVVMNMFGQTETTGIVTTYTLEPDQQELEASVPIGRPIASCQLYLLDTSLQPVPIGVPGEVYVGGPDLARGYLGSPELTAERFVPHPFVGIVPCADPGTRLYRTGDLARYCPDGTIQYLGRIDQQVKVRGFRIEPGEIEAALRAYPGVQEAAVVLRGEEQGLPSSKNKYLAPATPSLVAYVAPAASPLEARIGKPLKAAQLQDHLREQLPDYMVPTSIYLLERLPLTLNGKIDRKALAVAPVSSKHDEPTFVAAHSEVEYTLAAIWQQVLGLSQVGVHDNFFALGGDSILSMQIIARARQAGLRLTPKQLFQHQTIAQLAIVAQPLGQAHRLTEQAEVISPVPLTPIQQWFFDQEQPAPEHFNQSILLQVPFVGTGQEQGTVSMASLQQGLQQMLNAWLVQHDALRLRYEKTEVGWQQRLVSVAEAGVVAIERLDLSQIEEKDQAGVIKQGANYVQASLDLKLGPLLRVVLFELGNGRASRLLIVIHHLAVDGVSWRVLLSDLDMAMDQLRKGEPILEASRDRGFGGPSDPFPHEKPLSAPAVSFQRWAQHLQKLAGEAFLQKERAYWLKVIREAVAPLPLDCAQGSNTGAWMRGVNIVLTREETRLLLQEAPRPYRSHIQELLLVALLQTLARWMGTEQIRLDLEGHGREELGGEALDVSRTVGWFTSLYPVLFTVPRDGEPESAWIKQIKEQLRSVPHKGMGYGLLRYCSHRAGPDGDLELREKLASAPPSQVRFNYLGQFDQVGPSLFSSEGLLQSALGSSGETLGPQNRRSYLLDVSALVSGGQLRLQWIYCEQFHRRATIETLAQEFLQVLRNLLAHCLSPSAGGWTPSDFPLASLNQASLDRLLTGREKLIEDIYPLTPLQQGLLFHTLSAPGSGLYIEQMSWTLRGEVEAACELVSRAWQQVIRRHAILRTAFVWQELDNPLQIVFEQVKLPVNILDWRGHSPHWQDAELEAFLRTDRAQGFDVGQAPLMRLTLVQLSQTHMRVIWTHHHLLLDGWSTSLVLQEVLACYTAEVQEKTLVHEVCRPYRDYIGWLAERDDATAETYWRQALAGIVAPTPLPLSMARNTGMRAGPVGIVRGSDPAPLAPIQAHQPEQIYAEEMLEIDVVTMEQWKKYAQQQRLTLNTLVQATWALILSRYSGQTDVVFGTVVAGRPPELPGVERMIGLLINTVPVRIQVQEEEEVGNWLRQLQEQQAEQRSYEYSSLVQVQAWCSHLSGVGILGKETDPRRDRGFARPSDPFPHEKPLSAPANHYRTGSPNHKPLFESLLVFENYPMQVALSGQSKHVVMEGLQVVEQTNYPLTIVVAPALMPEVAGQGQGIVPTNLRANYDPRRFERATIQRLLRHFQTVLQQLVDGPQQRLVTLSLLTPEEREQLLVQWNTTTYESAPSLCLYQLFEQQVERTPDAIAVTFEQTGLTYSELNVRANQLAHYLSRRDNALRLSDPINRRDSALRLSGIGPEKFVGVCMDRSLELVIALLAVLKAGGAYVPLDPSYPQERLVSMLEDAQVSVVLTQTHLKPRLPASTTLFICLDTEEQPRSHRACPDGRAGPDSRAGLDVQSDVNPVSQVLPENLAYMIYTSGSTGKPKGVMVTHADVTRLFAQTNDQFHFQTRDSWTFFHSCAFDFSIWEIWGCLLHGGRLVVVPYWLSRSPDEFYHLLVVEQVTVLSQTPSTFRQLIEADAIGAQHQDLALRLIIFGGEALDLQSLRPWFARHGDQHPQLVNMYGITETTVHVTLHPLSQTDLQEYQGSVIGKPLADLQCYVLDAHQRLVPSGVAGELYVGGKGLTRGYWQRADVTAERFIPHLFVEAEQTCGARHDPYSVISELGARLYRTGDLVRYLATGDLEYVGRIDQQVKLRGFRIELGEIEVTLMSHPAIREAVVLCREDIPGEKRLVAYVVGEGSQALSISELRGHLQEKLPDYMLPAFFVLLDALPLTPHGKVDRKALPAPQAFWEKACARPEVTRTPIEELLVGLWGEILGCEQMGIHANFFELGGHSLLATRLVARLRTVLNISVPLRAVFEAPTIAELAKRVESLLRQNEGIEIPPLVPMVRPTTIPLSFAQQRLWFLDQLEPESGAYLSHDALRVIGGLDVHCLERSLQELVLRHESLRSTFVGAEQVQGSISGVVVQVIHAASAIPLPVIDLQGLEPLHREQQALGLAEQEAHRPCDLVKGPLLRMSLLQLERQVQVLLVTLHHIITDGWSYGVLVRELTTLYRAFLNGLPSPLDPLPVQYADYVLWQREWLRGKTLDALVNYWTRQLAGAVPLKLPTDRPATTTVSHRGATHSFKLSSDLLLQVIALSREAEATLFVTLLTAFQILLSRWTGQLDLALGTDIANRTVLETEQMIGFFVNLLVLRTQLDVRATFRETLRKGRATILDAYTHQDLPFEQLVEALHLPRNLCQTPLVNVLFVLQNTSQQALELPGLTVSSLEVPVTTVKFDVAVFLMESAGELTGRVNYRTDLFDPGSIARLVRHFEILLQHIVASPDIPIQGLEMLTEEEKRQQASQEVGLRETDRHKLHVARRRAIALPSGETQQVVEREETSFKHSYQQLDNQKEQ